jgi:sporulation protein YlmC with PRC-barrel domain
MLATEFLKMPIYDSAARSLGKIRDFEFDPNTLMLTEIVLELEDSASRELFGDRPLIGRSIAKAQASIIAKVGDAIILKQSIDELKGHLRKI